MNQKPIQGALKHADFMLLDIVALQLSFIIAHWVLITYKNAAYSDYMHYQAGVLALSQLLVIAFTQSYKNILKRDLWEEFISIVKYTIMILIVAVVILFLVHQTILVSRLQIGLTLSIFVIVGYLFRIANKKRILRSSTFGKRRKGKSLALVTTGALVDEAMQKLTDPETVVSFFVSSIFLVDDDFSSIKGNYDIQPIFLDDRGIEILRNEWVDEVLILQSSSSKIDKNLLDAINDMGLTVNYTLALLNDDEWPTLELRKLGKYKVLSSSIKSITFGQALAKRTMDIVGGIIGCLITGCLYIFVAPAIYYKSPGPIFFKQDRVGKNGKVFKMYKFRSMYLDAEERKASLMDQNKMDGLMFKMDDDPRIIGSEKKDKNGNPKGIGNFIRNTSIDEFPQFFNVLKGDMSLVGTRPPTIDEFEQYDLHHRARMTTKPGITGMWQVSGRSKITDFEEVVKLDKYYIKNWSLMLDIKILLKTIVVLIKREGAE